MQGAQYSCCIEPLGTGQKQKQGRSASPPKHIGNTYCHMQGAGLNVMLKVYILRDMRPGNMWKVGQGTTMHNSFLGCCHRVGLRSLYIRLVRCIFWLGSGVAWGLNIISMTMQTF